MRSVMSLVNWQDFPVRSNHRGNLVWHLDMPLLVITRALLCLSWVMVTSASLDYASVMTGDTFYFCKRHGIYLLLSLGMAAVVMTVPYSRWHLHYRTLFVVAVILLIAVLIPGIGRRVNGSQRWVNLGFMTLQVSELAKCASVIFFAGYLVGHREEMQKSFLGFLKPLFVLGIVAVLLLAEPDFGATVVIGLSSMSLLFLAGAPMMRFLPLMVVGVAGAGYVATMESYRMARLLAFVDPWEESVMYGSGYQLTQSLIAIGRGKWNGVGLGNSVQKLFYLPEAHTDFVFSIWAEEAGLAGCVVIIGLFGLMVWRMFVIARSAADRGEYFGSLVAMGLALTIAFQAFINMGVASGLLPTKGLTLPFISYGGSSMMISAVMSAMVLRLSFENRQAAKPHVVMP
jgi:cell division protein FtsW